MRWIDADASKPPDYETVLIRTIGGKNAHYTTGWWASKANNGQGAWIGLALNQSPPHYEMFDGAVQMWSYIEPPVTEVQS